jgi:diguanylate cyclase (GGDEF)-like protein
MNRIVRAYFQSRVGHLSRLLAFASILASFVTGALALAAAAQPTRSNPAGPQFVFRSYRQADGLRNLTVTALSRDTHGFLWVGTQNGLYRFLGSGFQQFGASEGILESTIEDVLAAPDGTVWVGTLKNLYRWTGERFVPAAPNPIRMWRAGRILFEGPGRLLMVDGDHLSRLVYRSDGSPVSSLRVFSEAFEASHPSLKELGSLARSQAALWFGCGGRLCVSAGPGNLTEWGKDQGVPDEYCYSIRFDGRGSLWTVLEHHVLELPPGASRFVDRTPPGDDPSSVYHRQPLALDPQGRVVASTGSYLERWDGSQWLAIGPSNGMTFGHLNALTFDANGDLWMGSAGQGLHGWTGYNNWEGWTDQEGLPSSSIWSPALFADGSIYTGTERGPATIDAATGAVTPLFPPSNWTYGQVGGLAMDNSGGLWAGTKSGALLRIDPRTGSITSAATVPSVILSLVREPSGRILVLTKKGVFGFVYSAGSKAVSAQSIGPANNLTGGPQRISNACAGPDGTLWFATRGVLKLQNGEWSQPAISGLATDTKTWSGISCAPDGTLWLMGRTVEIWHLTPRNGILEAAPLPPPDPYRSLALAAVLSDARGWLWLGTDSGLLVWNGSSWRHLTQESGLIWNDVNTNGLAAVPDGSIWIGTSNGLGHIAHPERVFDRPSLPISLVDIRRGAQHVLAQNLMSLSGSPDMSFEFAVPSISNRSDLAFSYRIAELDTAWLQTRDTNAHFAALPPGAYTFEVFARNVALDASSPVSAVRFRILPPWWCTWWSLGLSGLGALGVLFLLYRLRTRHLETLVRNRTLELEASRAELLSQATHDGLTGLLNRCAILDALNAELIRAQRENTALTVVLADIDHFKRVNDTYGHLAGDAALRRFAEALVCSTRTYDFAGRYGGEEFLILLPGVSSDGAAQRLAALHEGISNLSVIDRHFSFVISCSFGSVSVDPDQTNFEQDQILAAADQALYQAKAAGRNRIVHDVIAVIQV